MTASSENHSYRTRSAFTLVEMLVVLAIIGIMAGLTLPALKNLGKGNLRAAAVRQLMDDLSYARLKAISGRTDVYVAFMPSFSYLTNTSTIRATESFTNTLSGITNFFSTNLPSNKLLGGQLTSYVIFTRKRLGAQPGEVSPQFLTDWQFLPDGTYIPFSAMLNTRVFLNGNRWFNTSRSSDVPVPLPYPNAGNVISYYLPAIGFDSSGRLISEDSFRTEENDGSSLNKVRIPIFQGSALVAGDTAGTTFSLASVDAINTEIGVNTNELVLGQYYSVVADGNSTNHVVQHGITGGNERNHQPGDIFLATSLDTSNNGTNYAVINGTPKVVLFGGVEVSKLTGRVKVAKTRVGN